VLTLEVGGLSCRMPFCRMPFTSLASVDAFTFFPLRIGAPACGGVRPMIEARSQRGHRCKMTSERCAGFLVAENDSDG